jgi:hypothetical protein
MTPKELEQTIRGLIQQPMADAALREQLEILAATEISFSGFTWLYGPELYRRNRVFFRPFILSRFGTRMVLPKWRVERIHWTGDRARYLDAWLAEVDRNDDADLFRRLYEWKLEGKYNRQTMGDRSREIRAELTGRYRRADSPGRRQIVLRKFDLWFQLDETTALELYEIDPKLAGTFILRHLPHRWLGGEKRELWRQLIASAEAKKDDALRWRLYRRQVSLAEWERDGLKLCERVRDASDLCGELERRHPEGWGLNLAEGFYRIIQARGRDVFPYVTRHLVQVWRGWFGRGSYGKMAELARRQGWWDLWSALIRTCGGPKEYNKEIRALLDDKSLPEHELTSRLMALAGASREWNWPGLGLVTVHQLEEEVALDLYARFPDLLRGPFKLHAQPNFWGGSTYSQLLKQFIGAGDDEMLDSLASRLVTRHGRWGNGAKLLEEADKLADHYAAMKADEAVFSRRAANVLGKVPAFSIGSYRALAKENRLARLLFERSAGSYLADPRGLGDLVEGAEIHVMALAYRALGLDDPRARQQAPNHLTLLAGTLLRPMRRDTRALAFGALANAASNVETARMILDRARDALNLPDTRYPKERLLSLIAKVIHRWPELRGPEERPVVYERAA